MKTAQPKPPEGKRSGPKPRKCPMCGTVFVNTRGGTTTYCSRRCSLAIGRPTMCDTAKVLEDVADGMSFVEVGALHKIDRKAVRDIVKFIGGFVLEHGGNPGRVRSKIERWAPRLRALAKEWRRTIGTPEAKIIVRAELAGASNPTCKEGLQDD